MKLIEKQTYRVAPNAPSHAGREGVFEFMGGPDLDAVVLTNPRNPTDYFSVLEQHVETLPVRISVIPPCDNLNGSVNINNGTPLTTYDISVQDPRKKNGFDVLVYTTASVRTNETGVGTGEFPPYKGP